MSGNTCKMTRRDFVVATAGAVAAVGVLGNPTLTRAAGSAPVTLPAAKTDGKISLEAALAQRRSIRKFAAAPLTVEEVGQLCWAAQGVTDAKGHRTAPSALAIYPLEIYVAAGAVTGLAASLYHYRPVDHSLQIASPEDKREVLEKLVGQSWNPISKAPAVFVMAGAVEKMTGRMKERGLPFMWVEAGLAAENLFLQATALGLGSVYTGGFPPKETHAALGLPASEEILGILPVGRRM